MSPIVDLTDLDMWAHGVPYGEFARLRRDAPVAWCDEAPPNSGFWSVHCHGRDRHRHVRRRHLGLRANVVCPGWTVTEMADEEMAAFGAERGVGVPEAYERVIALVPQRRPAHADEVAAVVAWLLSDAASYVNGAVIPVDGSAAAVDVGTMAFDPRISLRPADGEGGPAGAG